MMLTHLENESLAMLDAQAKSKKLAEEARAKAPIKSSTPNKDIQKAIEEAQRKMKAGENIRAFGVQE